MQPRTPQIYLNEYDEDCPGCQYEAMRLDLDEMVVTVSRDLRVEADMLNITFENMG